MVLKYGNFFRCLVTLAAAVAVLVCPARPAPAVETFDGKISLLKNREYLEELLTGVRNAKKSILFSFHLFKAKGMNEPARIADELVKAHKRGVDVTVVLERAPAKDKLNEENLHTAALLARNGIKVFFDSPEIVTHMKVAVIDSRYVFIGSHNLTDSALEHNNEISVMIDSPPMAKEIRSYINKL